MTPRHPYTPSKLLPEESEPTREHAFTRWMSLDLLQAASDFLTNLALLPVYTECSEKGAHRYLLWHPPAGTAYEVRSGRSQEQFLAFDRRNMERGCPLLSLHINEKGIYSAVWISEAQYDVAVAVLQHFGITPAGRPPAG